MVMLMKAYEFAPDTNPTGNFADAGDTYYTGYPALEAKDYAWAAELYDLILNANPQKTSGVIAQAKTDYAEALRQLGFQSEAATWRNMYLTGAQEISQYTGGGNGGLAKTYLEFPDSTIKAMSLEMILQYMGIMLDSRKVEADGYRLAIEFIAATKPDGASTYDRKYAIASINRGVLNYRIVDEKSVTGKVDLAIAGEKVDLFRYFIDQDLSKKANLKFVSDVQQQIADDFITGYLTRFPIAFPIMTPRSGL
jgi:alkyl sulfatase BDS1-like metallo-beta-lactamase superfamily hydrolase